MITLKTILVATDFSAPSTAAFAYGRALAARFGATLHVLHVVQHLHPGMYGFESYTGIAADLQQQLEDEARRRLDVVVRSAAPHQPSTVAALLTAHAPAAGIVDYARSHDVDLIVMGTHGYGAITQLVVGSVAEQVVRFASCPVLTLKSAADGQHEPGNAEGIADPVTPRPT